MGPTDSQKTSSRFNLRKARTCLTLLFVNAVLIVGIIVAASRTVRYHIKTSPTPATHNKNNSTTLAPSPGNGSENIRLQSLEMHNIPEEIQDALIKVHRYMESKTIVNSNRRCQFAWKFNSRDNSTNLFICN
ncbi:hypothetical protein ACROYT_G042615 [Oculina patagonica]